EALLARRTFSGIDRTGGGTFERHFIHLDTFGDDGRITRLEHFDVDREDQALARFDELVADRPTGVAMAPPTAAKRARRVRPNAATEYAARVDAAFAARDFEAISGLIAEDSELIEHTTGATSDRQGELSSFRALLACENPAFRQEPLATLGDSLALCGWSRSATRFAGGALDVGAFEMQEMLLVEVDALRRHIRGESFATDHLGDAVVRLYERYADLLPDGPERKRIVAPARPIATHVGPLDSDRAVAAWAPAVEFVDHRMIVGIGSVHGSRAFRDALRTLVEATNDMVNRVDDVLDLRSGA